MFSIVTAARDLSRLREIYVVLVRHGFGEIVSRLQRFRHKDARKDKGLGEDEGEQADPADRSTVPPPSSRVLIEDEDLTQGKREKATISLAERLRLVAQDLGPTFVKLGQLLSTRSDILPEDIINELRKLQDDVPPVPFEEIRRQVENALGVPLEEIFEQFDVEPLAAASIGQVHRAKLRTDEGPVDVAVKVQRPGIQQVIARDLDLLHGLARLIEKSIPESRVYSPRRLVAQFDRAITSELDFSGEAENAARFVSNFANDPNVTFPKVYRHASARVVLTLSFINGKKVYDAIEAGFSREKIAKLALRVVIKQIMEDGFFHADPHPGNILLLGAPNDPIFALLDLGMVGRLSEEMRDLTLDLMVAAVRKDYVGIADAMYAIARPTRKVDMRAYRADVSELADRYLGKELGEIEISALVKDIIQGATRHGLEVPADFLLVAKALMTIEGVAKEIYPEMDIFSEARPYFLQLLRKRYSPQRIGNEMWRGMEKLSAAAYQMPSQLSEVLDDLREGRLTVRTSTEGMSHAADRLGRRVFTGLVIMAFVISGTWLLGTKTHPILAHVLLGLGVLILIGHVLMDWIRDQWRKARSRRP